MGTSNRAADLWRGRKMSCFAFNADTGRHRVVDIMGRTYVDFAGSNTMEENFQFKLAYKLR
jgi:hypothetical protein